MVDFVFDFIAVAVAVAHLISVFWSPFQVELWRSLDDDARKSFVKKSAKCPDPVPSLFRPDSNFGSVTETIDDMIENYVDKESRKIVLPIKGAKPFDPEEFRVRLIFGNCCIYFRRQQ